MVPRADRPVMPGREAVEGVPALPGWAGGPLWSVRLPTFACGGDGGGAGVAGVGAGWAGPPGSDPAAGVAAAGLACAGRRGENVAVAQVPGPVRSRVPLGRATELGEVAGFLAPVRAGRVLVVCGEPGIGKSTVWEAGAGLARSRGFAV